MLCIGGQFGMLLIRKPDERYGSAEAEHWRVSTYSLINKIVFHPNGNMAAGELDGSGGINTYLYVNGALRAVIEGMDSSDFQFTRDGKYLVVTSYNKLDVVECETGKIIRTKEIGEMFEDSIDLVAGGEGRFALLTTRDDHGNFVSVQWWDPILNHGIPPQANVKDGDWVWKAKDGFRSVAPDGAVAINNRYMISRSTDRTKYIVRSSQSGVEIGSIAFPRGELAPQSPSFVGSHGLVSPGFPSSVFDLRSCKRVAKLYLGQKQPTSYSLVTEDGYVDGDLVPDRLDVASMKKDSERVWKTLLDGCGRA